MLHACVYADVCLVYTHAVTHQRMCICAGARTVVQISTSSDKVRYESVYFGGDSRSVFDSVAAQLKPRVAMELLGEERLVGMQTAHNS